MILSAALGSVLHENERGVHLPRVVSWFMHDTFAAFLERPAITRYKEVRQLVLTCDQYARFAIDLAEAERLTQDNKWGEAVEAFRALMPQGLLSLRLHRLAGEAEELAGDVRRAMLHREVYAACRETMLATGNGTRTRPLLVTYASDSRELLFAAGHDVRSQAVVEDGRRRYDVLLTANEREFWFDLTDLVPVPATKSVPTRRPAKAARKVHRQGAVVRTRS